MPKGEVMNEKEMVALKEKKMKICKITTFIMTGLAFVFIALMIAWLLVRKHNQTAMIVLSIVAGIFVLLIIATCLVYFKNKKDADQLQHDIDNE